MSEERKQEHAGFSVTLDDVGIVVKGDPCEVQQFSRTRAIMVLPTLDSAEALRDALSAFIAFHRPRADRPT